MPANVTNVLAEVKEETQNSLSVRLCWDIDARASLPEYDMTLNADGNIDHFEILYKNGENGRISEVARTTSWGAYVGNIPMSADEKCGESMKRVFGGTSPKFIRVRNHYQVQFSEEEMSAINRSWKRSSNGLNAV